MSRVMYIYHNLPMRWWEPIEAKEYRECNVWNSRKTILYSLERR